MMVALYVCRAAFTDFENRDHVVAQEIRTYGIQSVISGFFRNLFSTRVF